MNNKHDYAPHVGGDRVSGSAPNAALLIDFDNVTMGMRSDLSKDLRKLLQSEVIRGKVTVQRAYADWRRYPQYIVPLSENSIDLIFAPAYGSSKKNATDIRMAIDGMELIFTRPEIGTYILLTGDSDFSSLVLKLKEYGKYVIGVGIQESSSDILVQNCDEYYSYTNLAGLTKTTETDVKSMDPWLLVEKAVQKMQDRDDVMRSDRLKQVMIEIDSTFDEGSYGFSKFSKFVTEAASRKLITLKKMANGQYEVSPGASRSSSSSSRSGSRRKADDDRGGRSRSRSDRKSSGRGSESRSRSAPEKSAPPAPPVEVDSVGDAFALLTKALESLKDEERYPTRDSDVKRKMLEFDGNFDESTLGFSKFSVFLREARDRDVVELERQDGGSYEVSLGDAADAPRAAAEPEEEDGEDRGAPSREPGADASAADGADTSEPERSEDEGPVTREIRPEDVVSESSSGRRLGPRGGTTRRRDDDGPPPILEGQGRPSSSSGPADAGESDAAAASADDRGGEAVISKATPDFVDLESLNLPDETRKIVNYLKNYKGVGEKTAQQVVETFGKDTFVTLQERPEALKDVIPAGRADQLLTGWQEDLERRVSENGGEGNDGGGRKGGRSRRGGRNRRGGRSSRGRK